MTSSSARQRKCPQLFQLNPLKWHYSLPEARTLCFNIRTAEPVVTGPFSISETILFHRFVNKTLNETAFSAQTVSLLCISE